MKLKNAPGRKNDRRIDALAKILETDPDKMTTSQKHEKETLEALIVHPNQARAIRTKKSRGAK